MILAIIPARGGSKRIPKKNIRNFLGKPLISYSINACLESQLFDEIIVSTDDDEIKNISIKLGAKVPFMRSPKNSDDFATTADVIKEVLENYSDNGKTVTSFCCVYPTATFATKKKLQESHRKFTSEKPNNLISICRFSYPIQRALKINSGFIAFNQAEHINTRSQDLEPMYHDAGQFYWSKAREFLKNNTLIDDKTIGFELPELEVQDIDNESDWDIAEIKYKKLYGDRL